MKTLLTILTMIYFTKEMVDIDENQELAQQYQIMSIPTLVIEQDGQVVDAVLGSTSKDDLVQRLS